jgi:hypothetical protein
MLLTGESEVHVTLVRRGTPNQALKTRRVVSWNQALKPTKMNPYASCTQSEMWHNSGLLAT